ncbi:MAG: ester cyclase, partial [Bacteroidota bacterium]|nr:ester cyclase [Bacteroidota bacterium]
METVLKTNKEVIRTLYEGVLNQRKFDLVDKIVSEDYISVQSERGIEAFKRSLKTVIDAFPDAKWTLEAIVAEGNTVMVRQTLTGKHKNKFQNIPPTGQTISNEGFAQYELIDGKIVRH